MPIFTPKEAHNFVAHRKNRESAPPILGFSLWVLAVPSADFKIVRSVNVFNCLLLHSSLEQINILIQNMLIPGDTSEYFGFAVLQSKPYSDVSFHR
jgi:hypothetical protein